MLKGSSGECLLEISADKTHSYKIVKRLNSIGLEDVVEGRALEKNKSDAIKILVTEHGRAKSTPNLLA
jgi:hypothetical protein